MNIKPLAVMLPLISLSIGCLESGRGTSLCRTELTYTCNPFTQGEQSVHHASVYKAPLMVGSDDNLVEAIVDTASSDLVINNKSYEIGTDSALGAKPYGVTRGAQKSLAINAKDTLDVGCMENIKAQFALTAQEQTQDNYLGLAYTNAKQQTGEKNDTSFFNQLRQQEQLDNEFSLALCGARSNSWILLGGIDDKLIPFIGNFIPIIEKTAYVVPAQNIRRADTKAVFGNFPGYDAADKTGIKTIIDSATSFLLLPSDMAQNLANEIYSQADALGFMNQIPSGFFRIERSSSLKPVRFNNITQIRQLPWFEITFVGTDNKTKALELSPLHYLKEIDPADPLVRVFAIRETSGDVVLGQPFLENHYTYFDRAHARIGFAHSDVACGAR